jgi:hypothetical protein
MTSSLADAVSQAPTQLSYASNELEVITRMDDDYSYYEREDALEQLVQDSLRSISTDSVKQYLGRFGDAVELRVNRYLEMARELSATGFAEPAVVCALTATELMIRYLLVRPLVQGAFLSDEWAAVLSGRIANARTVEDRRLLPAMLSQWEIDIESLTLADGTYMWASITSALWPLRNKIVHQGSLASKADASAAIECSEALQLLVVHKLAENLGFTLPVTGKWAEIAGEAGSLEQGNYRSWGQTFTPASPFEA